jgi:RNase P/RNase MRP subunit POP5
MLNRRYKRRYVSIMHDGGPNDSVNAIIKRFCELFGSIATEKAAIRLVRSNANQAIIRCRWEELDNVLVAITLTDPPAVTVDISGSIRRLRLRKDNASRQEKRSQQYIKK